MARYRALFNMAQQRGHTWGKSRNQAAALGICLRTFRSLVAALRAAGWITTTNNGRELWIYPLIAPPLESDESAGPRAMAAPSVPVPSIAQLNAALGRRRAAQRRRIPTVTSDSTLCVDETTDTASEQKPTPIPAPSDPGFAAAVEILRQEGMPETSAKQIAREIPDAKRLRDAVAYYRQRKAAGQNIRNWIGYVLQVARVRITPPDTSRSAPTPHRGTQQASGRHTEEWHERQAAAENRLTRASSDFLVAEAEARAKKKAAAEAERRAFLARKGVAA